MLSTVLLSCWYKAGNLVELGYPVNTPLRLEIVQRYLDTLIEKKGYEVPEKWKGYNKLVDLDSVRNKRIYFKSDPEEMYLVSLQGMVVLSDVFNPEIKKYDWVSEKDSMPKEEEIRVMTRFKNEILDTIEAMAKRDGVPDSLIYQK